MQNNYKNFYDSILKLQLLSVIVKIVNTVFIHHEMICSVAFLNCLSLIIMQLSEIIIEIFHKNKETKGS